MYFILKYGWHPSTPDLIWWHVHGKAMMSYSKSNQRRIRKYIFSWLPTCERLFRYEHNGADPDPTKEEARCQSCKTIIENRRHLITCNSFQRATLEVAWFADLKIFLDNDRYTPPIISFLIYNHVIQASYVRPTIMPIIPELSPATQRAVTAQQQIGWDQILLGRISIEWGNLIAYHLSANRVPPIEMTANRWGKLLISMMFQLLLDLWDQRNTDAHQHSDNNESQLS